MTKAASVCVVKDCEEDMVNFCKTFREAFCRTHTQAHTEYVKILKASHDVVTVEENSGYCNQHQQAPIFIACKHCYKPLCAECVDERRLLEQCASAGREQHDTGSIKQVSHKIKEELPDLLKELRVREIMISDGMKEREHLYNEQMKEYHYDQERLAVKVKELHEMIDDHYKEWKDTLVDHMNKKKEMMDTHVDEFVQYQRSCEEMYERTVQYMKQSDASIVKDRHDSKLEQLMEFQFNDNPEQFIKLALKITDNPVKLPIFVQTEHPKHLVYDQADRSPAVRAVTNLELKYEITATSTGRCVQYSQTGSLLHSGDCNLTSNPSLPVGENISLYEHKSSLYVLQFLNNNYHIHVINLDGSVDKSIIMYTSDATNQQISVTDEQILISHYGSWTILVYSTATHKPMFYIQDPSMLTQPYGLAVLGDTLIVGECGNNNIINMTISQTPEVKWKTQLDDQPTSIEVNEVYQIIVVGCPKQVHVLSYHGEILSTLDIPQCSSLLDLSTYRNQLAVADGTWKIKIYEMKLQEQAEIVDEVGETSSPDGSNGSSYKEVMKGKDVDEVADGQADGGACDGRDGGVDREISQLTESD